MYRVKKVVFGVRKFFSPAIQLLFFLAGGMVGSLFLVGRFKIIEDGIL
jgi:hypothetical protein